MAYMTLFQRSSILKVVGLALGLGLSATAQAQYSDQKVNLDQGWSQADAKTWWEMSQGSRLVPLAWLRALEQPDGSAPFLADDYIAQFRYIPGLGATDKVTGKRLPLGFALDHSDSSNYQFTNIKWKSDQGSNEPWVGMTCSACHSNEVTYKGTQMLIEGAPTLADFQSFIDAFNLAISRTLSDPLKFARFAQAVLGHPDSDGKLRLALNAMVEWQFELAAANATPTRYGFARLDAFGNIFNKVALSVHARVPTAHPSDAPVSYPFMWNVPQQNKVQWNGIAPKIVVKPNNFDLGAVLRNIGEVIGVFGDINPKRFTGVLSALEGYPNSIDINGIIHLEDMLTRLKPPAWPDGLFGKPDAQLVAQGKTLFTAQCAMCHQDLKRDDLTTAIDVVMSQFNGDVVKGTTTLATKMAPGTDPWMACNAVLDMAASGVLYRTPTISPENPQKIDWIKRVAPSAQLLTVSALGVVLDKKGELVIDMLRNVFQAPTPDEVMAMASTENVASPWQTTETYDARLKKCQVVQNSKDSAANALLAYKGRPLTGIWATAPYLHNGSVPTLYDLLLPVAQRPQRFYVGSREFDPVKVGFITNQSADNSFLFQTIDAANNPIPGNSNAGHEYGTTLSEADRQALLAYMKKM